MKPSNRKQWVLAGILIGAAAIAMTVQAGPYKPINTTYSFEGSDWQSPAWTLTGDSYWAYDTQRNPPSAYHRLRLTDNGTGKTGAAWLNTDSIFPTEDWSMGARGEITDRIGGGDQMGFVLQTAGLGAVLSWGTYLSVTLDSYKNPTDPYPNTLWVNTSSGGALGSLNLGDGLARDDYFNFYATYTKSTHNLWVEFDSDALAPVTANFTVDLSTVFGDSMATVGFAGWTGAASENHDLMSMNITADVPEPSFCALMVAGASLLALRTRKQTRK